MRTRKVLELHRAMIEPSYVFHSKQTCTPLLRVEVHSQNCPLANVVDGRDGWWMGGVSVGRGMGNSATPTCDFEAPKASTEERMN